MKGASQSNSKIESPKTPGGISKSLLTPCRRVGLSRKWKKGGSSPFISPLTTQNFSPEKRENTVTRVREKRKKCEDVEILKETNEKHTRQHTVSSPILNTPDSSDNSTKNNDIITTPSRNTQAPHKKLKTFSLSLKNECINNKEEDSQDDSHESIKCMTEGKPQEVDENDVTKEINFRKNKFMQTEIKKITQDNVIKPTKQESHENVTRLARTESKSKIKLSLKRSNSKNVFDQDEENIINKPSESEEKSPNNLTKECIVVIQKNIFKTDSEKTTNKIKISQESDSEADIPLSVLKKDTENFCLNTPNDNDFICNETKEVPQKKKVRNLSIIKHTNPIETSDASQTSQEDIDKRTILIKRTYNKVTKPTKAKSTGSITQKDIDELRARIEKKKKLLMAKAMSIDTEELRELIKKWQKGCQNALMDLLELMKTKLPDQQNMDYAEILQTLNIPPELVGYDSDNDCFLTPDDSNILLATFKL